ncbi:FkbM family methyltransferase [Phormidesmis sp. 146-12]
MRKVLREKVRDVLIRIYRLIFLRKSLFRLNQLIFQLSLRGIGLLNYDDDQQSGEDAFLNQISEFLDDGVVIDVGANVGEYSNKVRRLSQTAKIYAFEPHPITFEKLSDQASQHHYTAINAACSDIQGKLKLYDYQGDQSGSTHASLYQDVISNIHKGASESWEVDVITLDEFIQHSNLDHIRLLKVDTEGNELKVLLGTQQTLKQRNIDMVQFEFNEMNIVSRVFLKDILNLLTDYSFYRLLPDGLIPMGDYSPMHWEIFAYQNIVAINKKFLPEVQHSLKI